MVDRAEPPFSCSRPSLAVLSFVFGRGLAPFGTSSKLRTVISCPLLPESSNTNSSFTSRNIFTVRCRPLPLVVCYHFHSLCKDCFRRRRFASGLLERLAVGEGEGGQLQNPKHDRHHPQRHRIAFATAQKSSTAVFPSYFYLQFVGHIQLLSASIFCLPDIRDRDPSGRRPTFS